MFDFKKMIIAFAVTATSSIGFAASGERTGWYVGGELADAAVEVEAANQFFLDESATGFSAYGGYNFTAHLGLEGNLFVTDDLADGRQNLRRAEFSTFSVMPKLTLPLSQHIDVYAKAGAVFAAYSEDYRRSRTDWYETDAGWNDLVLGGGVGAQVEASPRFHVRVGYDYADGELSEDRYSDFTPVSEIEFRLKRLSLGVHYQF